LTELPAAEGRTAEKIAKMVVVAEIAALWLDLVENSWTMVARSSGKVDLALKRWYSSLSSLAEFWQYSSWFLDTLRCYDLFRDTGSRSMDILGCGLWVSRCSSPFPAPGCESSSCVWSVVLNGLRIFHIVDVSRVLELRFPRHFSVSLSCFISFSNSSAVIIIGHDVLFKFMEKFINCFGFLSWQMWSCWSWSQTLDQCVDRSFIIRFRNLGSLLNESSYEVP
jgi:hypothetical protein